MATLEALIPTYCAAWNEPDPGTRRRLLDPVWGEGATYTDPTVHLAGVQALVDHITAVQARRPGARIEMTSVLDTHHGLCRFAWHCVLADGTALPEGIDFAELGADGRLARIIGFFGPLKPLYVGLS
jgi:hypothetical protein